MKATKVAFFFCCVLCSLSEVVPHPGEFLSIPGYYFPLL